MVERNSRNDDDANIATPFVRIVGPVYGQRSRLVSLVSAFFEHGRDRTPEPQRDREEDREIVRVDHPHVVIWRLIRGQSRSVVATEGDVSRDSLA